MPRRGIGIGSHAAYVLRALAPARAAHELFYGAYKGQRMAENLARVDALQFEMLDFDREDARQAGELRP